MEDNRIKTNKQAGLSYLRIFATISIICLHTCSTLTDNMDVFSVAASQVHFLNAGHIIWRWAVPVFFMITGALLLDPCRQITYKDCICKYCRKIILALLIFGIPMTSLILISNGVYGTALIKGAIIAFFTGQSFAHFWYLYTLIGIYLLLPLLKSFIANADKRDLEIIIIIMFVITIIIPAIERTIAVNIAFFIPLGYPVFYVLIGYYLEHYMRVKYTLLIILGIVITTIIYVSFVYNDIWVYELAQNYDNPITAIEASLIFLLFKSLNKRTIKKYVWVIDRLCFVVYIIHPVFIQFFYRYLHITPLSVGCSYQVAVIGMWLLFVVCSFLCGWVLKKIPILGKYVI